MVHDINRQIRAIRKKKGLTLQALSDLCNLSKGYLSKIERSEDAPRLPTLKIIADAFNLEINEFFEQRDGREAESRDIDLMKRMNREKTEVLTQESGYSYQALIHHYKGKYMSPFVLRIKPGMTPSFSRDSEEFLYVLEGEVLLTYQEKKYLLEKGDGVYFDSRIDHGYLNEGEEDADLLVVYFEYKRF